MSFILKNLFKPQVILVPTVMSSSTADVQWDSVASSLTSDKDLIANRQLQNSIFQPLGIFSN